jgi:hypothetical protein
VAEHRKKDKHNKRHEGGDYSTIMTSLRYLTEEQWQSYQTNGYLVIENFSSSNQICNLKSQILKIIDNTDPSTVQGVFATGVKQLVRVA